MGSEGECCKVGGRRGASSLRMRRGREDENTILESVFRVPLVEPGFRDNPAARRGKKSMFFETENQTI